jgi:hypothetical protein
MTTLSMNEEHLNPVDKTAALVISKEWLQNRLALLSDPNARWHPHDNAICRLCHKEIQPKRLEQHWRDVHPAEYQQLLDTI